MLIEINRKLFKIVCEMMQEFPDRPFRNDELKAREKRCFYAFAENENHAYELVLKENTRINKLLLITIV